jgi:hypothetical protein
VNFPTQTGRFAIGDLKLQSGEVLGDAVLIGNLWRDRVTGGQSTETQIQLPRTENYPGRSAALERMGAPRAHPTTRAFLPLDAKKGGAKAALLARPMSRGGRPTRRPHHRQTALHRLGLGVIRRMSSARSISLRANARAAAVTTSRGAILGSRLTRLGLAGGVW